MSRAGRREWPFGEERLGRRGQEGSRRAIARQRQEARVERHGNGSWTAEESWEETRLAA